MVAVIPLAVDLFLILLASSAVILRLISRYLSGAKLWYDDWFAFAALPFCFALCASFWAAAYHGFGKHGGDPTFFLHVHYFAEFWYMAGVMLTKLSVLCFYLRIFAVTLSLKLAIWTTSILVVLYWIVATIVIIIQCHPIPHYWNASIPGTCVEEFRLILGIAIPDLVLDFVVLLLPVIPLWRLQMEHRQKIGLLVVFILGYTERLLHNTTRNPLITILRLVTYVKMETVVADDLNYSSVPLALWSTGEISVGIFSSSIPSLTPLFRRVFSVLAPSQSSSNSRPPQDVNGIKPATIGSLPSRGPKKPLSESFSRLDDETNVSETELSIFKPAARPIVFGGPAMDIDGLDKNIDSHPTQILVRKDIDVSYKDVEKGAS
ncbi:integral membrane protein [Rutstroemia sp. NJR-2017a WRK4]|nr:integral membrane protein [Rutstroemia sp. NJR-2017a WRK4]